MLRELLAVLGTAAGRPLRRALAWMAVDAVLQGVAFLLLVPVLREALGPEPADAWPWIGAFAAVVAVFAGCHRVSQVAGYRTGAQLSRSLHHRLGDHLSRLPVGWFSPDRVGEVGELTSRGVLGVMNVPAHLAKPLVDAAVLPATVAVGLFFVDWRLALVALGAGAALVWVQRAGAVVVRRRDEGRARGNALAVERVVEFVRAQPVLRASGSERETVKRVDEALTAQQQALRHLAFGALPGAFGLALTVQAAFTALLVLGVWLTLDGGLDAPALLAVLALVARSVEPLLAVTDKDGSIQVARGALRRMSAVLAAQPLPEPDRPEEPDGRAVTLEAVEFGRDGQGVLHDVTLEAPEGSVTALVGPSGAGKSTVLRLIMRFHDVDGGSVRVGGTDVRRIGTERLVSMISAVFQDTYLFQGTIEENVRIGRPGADDRALRRAASAARLDEMLGRLPDGWETQVGEGGFALSGGERQRVSIARALLKDAPIVLLDEATSALDAENEAAVRAGMEALMAGRTVIVVAHRMETVAAADRIVFMEGGRAVECGTHAGLLARGGRYADFRSAASAHENGGLITR